MILKTTTEEGSYFDVLKFNDISEDYYKVGFHKLPNEEIIEVVVTLNGVKEHLEKIEMHNLLNEIKNSNNIQEARFIDDNFTVISSTDSTLENTNIHYLLRIIAIIDAFIAFLRTRKE